MKKPRSSRYNSAVDSMLRIFTDSFVQERLKREYKNANKTREGYIDESEEEDDVTELTGAGKDMRKLMKKHEKNNSYDDSDDDKNPYASSVSHGPPP